jgi:hypothetical protein
MMLVFLVVYDTLVKKPALTEQGALILVRQPATRPIDASS